MTSPETEYAIIATGRGITIQTAALIQNGFSEPADAMDYIRGLGLRECMVVAVSDGVRRFLDGYEVGAINKSLRLGDTEHERDWSVWPYPGHEQNAPGDTEHE